MTTVFHEAKSSPKIEAWCPSPGCGRVVSYPNQDDCSTVVSDVQFAHPVVIPKNGWFASNVRWCLFFPCPFGEDMGRLLSQSASDWFFVDSSLGPSWTKKFPGEKWENHHGHNRRLHLRLHLLLCLQTFGRPWTRHLGWTCRSEGFFVLFFVVVPAFQFWTWFSLILTYGPLRWTKTCLDIAWIDSERICILWIENMIYIWFNRMLVHRQLVTCRCVSGLPQAPCQALADFLKDFAVVRRQMQDVPRAAVAEVYSAPIIFSENRKLISSLLMVGVHSLVSMVWRSGWSWDERLICVEVLSQNKNHVFPGKCVKPGINGWGNLGLSDQDHLAVPQCTVA